MVALETESPRSHTYPSISSPENSDGNILLDGEGFPVMSIEPPNN
jgi:hypothetical protein